MAFQAEIALIPGDLRHCEPHGVRCGDVVRLHQTLSDGHPGRFVANVVLWLS